MDWDSALQTLGQFSPVVGTAIGGPVGAAVGVGIKGLISLITGKSDPQEAIQVLQQDPEKLAEFELKVRELENEHLKLELGDVSNARSQTVELAKVGSAVAWGAPIVSAIVLGGFFTCIDLLFISKVELTPTKETLLNTLFGALIPMAIGVVNYWTGSTMGSQQKDHLLANSIPVQGLPWLGSNKGSK